MVVVLVGEIDEGVADIEVEICGGKGGRKAKGDEEDEDMVLAKGSPSGEYGRAK